MFRTACLIILYLRIEISGSRTWRLIWSFSDWEKLLSSAWYLIRLLHWTISTEAFCWAFGKLCRICPAYFAMAVAVYLWWDRCLTTCMVWGTLRPSGTSNGSSSSSSSFFSSVKTSRLHLNVHVKICQIFPIKSNILCGLSSENYALHGFTLI